MNSNGTLVNGVQIANASVAFANQQLFFHSNFSSENASREENSTFKWLKRTMYQPQNRSLVLYMKLDGNANDSSSAGNHGTIINATPNQSQNCAIDECLFFAGVNSYVNASNASSLNLGNASTIELWVYTKDAASPGGRNKGILDKMGGTGGYQIYLKDINTISYSFASAFDSNTALAANTWYHLAFTSNGSEQRIYINGIMDKSNSVPNSFLGTALDKQPLWIGSLDLNADWFWNGSIDEVAVYNYAKSADEILNDYKNSPYSAMIYKDALFYLGFEDNGTNSAAGNVGGLLNATVINVTNVTGVIGTAFNFSETSSIYFPFSQLLNLTGNFTFTAWIQPQNVTLPEGQNYIIFDNLDYTGGPRRGWRLYYGTPSSSNINLEVWNGSTVSNASGSRAGSVPEYAWSQVVGVYNGSHIAVYVNGELHDTDIAPIGGFPKANTGISIGYQSVENGVAHINGDSAFNGLIDEVALYNRSLSPQEIKQLYLRTWYDYSPQLFLLHPNYPDEVDNSTQNTTLLMHFDTNSSVDVIDSSPYNNSGNVSGAAFTNTSISGRALSFNGVSAYVNISDSNSLDMTSAVTVEAWIYPATLSSAASIVRKGASTNGVYYLYLSSDGYIRFAINDVGWDGGGYLLPSANRWYHVAGTYDGSAKKLYVDGALVNYSAQTGAITANALKLTVGQAGDNTEFFSGLVDELKIVNRSLTAAEIAADYRKGARFATTDYEMPLNNGTAAGGAVWQPGRFADNLSTAGAYVNTTLYLKFDEGSGQNVSDVSGYNNYGILGANGNSGTDDPQWVNDSVSGYAVKLNGNQYLVVNHSDSISIAGSALASNAITISLWFKPDLQPDREIILFSKGTQSYGASLGGLNVGSIGFNRDGISTLLGTSNGAFKIGRWNYLTFTNSGSVVRIYVDGILQAEAANTATWANTSTNLGIGARPDGSLPTNGTIDEFRIINRSLSADEILADYRRQARALGLLSNAFINYSNNNSQNFNTVEGAVEFWVKPVWDGNDGLAHTFFSTETAAAFNITKTAGNDLAVYAGNPGSVLVSSSAAGWTNGTWKHVGITWSNYTTNLTLQVDGAVVNMTGAKAFTIPAQKSFIIGARATGAADWCNCTISEFRISRKPLSPQEINESFSKGRQYYSNEHLLNSSNYRKDDVLKLEYAPADSQAATGARQNTTTLAVQNSPPVGNISFPLRASPNMSTSLNWLNVTNLSDADGDTISVNWFVNGSFNQSGANVTLAATPERNYVINMSLTDGVVNTANISVSFMFDNVTPVLAYAASSFANASFVNASWIFLNFSFTETNNDTFMVRNGSTNWTNVNASGGYFFYNFTNRADGNYTFFGWINDSSGQVAQTVNRTIVVDTAAPAISFVANTPANASVLNTNAVLINTSENDAGNNHNDFSAFVNFDGSLVAYWRFEEGTGLNTSSFTGGVNQNGSLLNFGCASLDCNSSSGWTSAGRRGKAIKFDGINDEVSVAADNNPSGLNLDRNQTWEAWLKFDNSKPDVWGHIINNNGFNLFTYDGYLVARLGDQANDAYGPYTVRFTTTIPQNNTWYHVALTYNSSHMLAYLNGVHVNTTNRTAGGISSSYTLTIGGGSFPNGIFNGTIDEVKAWSRALSPQEINASFSAGSYRLFSNLTNLADGNYSYRAFAVDAAGNINQTAGQNITVDATAPVISFIAPTDANNSFLNRSWTLVNTSVTESGESSAFINFNSSLVLYWRMEDSDGLNVTDFTSNGYNGTLSNFSCLAVDCNLTGGLGGTGSGRTSSGKRGRALLFDGVDDHAQTFRSVPMNGNAISMAAWFRTNTSGWIMGFATNSGYHQDVAVSGQGWISYYNNGFNGIKSVRNVSDNSWHHLVVMSNATHSAIYIDGALDRLNISTAGVAVSGQSFFVGGRNDSTTLSMPDSEGGGVSGFFNGTIDEVMVWNRELSAQEVNASFQAGTYRLSRNFSGLNDGNYSYYAAVVDSAGNLVQTTNRTIYVDTKGPAITYDASSFANATLNKFVTINVTSNDTNSDHNDFSAFVDFNNSLVLYLRFEDGSGTNATDFSSYGNHGNMTNFGCTTLNCNLTGGTGGTGSGWTSGGKRGRALAFDGQNDFVNVSTDGSLNFSRLTNQITIEYWAYVKGFMAIGGTIDNYANTGVYQSSIDDQGGVGSVRMSIVTNETSPDSGTGNVIRAGQWYHIAGTYDGSRLRTYVNGIIRRDDAGTGNLSYTNRLAGLWIGQMDNTYFFNGSIDEVKIWNRALSAQEVNASFQAGSYRLIANITGSQYADGNSSYTAYTVDAAGNVNVTGQRLAVLDNTVPVINAVRTISNMSSFYYQVSNSTSAVVAYFNSVAPAVTSDGGGGQAVTVEVTYADLYRNSLAGNLTFGMVPFNHTALGTSTITYNISTGSGNATALVMANDTANNTATATVRLILDMNDTVTTDNSSSSSTWFSKNVSINLTAVDTANGSGANRTLWCTFSAGLQPCTPTVEVFNPSGTFTLPVNCSSPNSCQVRVRYYSIDNVSNNESGGSNGGVIRESNSINIATSSTDVNDTLTNNTAVLNGSFVRTSNLTNSTVNNCRVTGSVVVRSVLFRNIDHLHNCTVSDSFVLDSNITSSIVERQSYVDPSIITDSVITNSTIHNSTVSYSRIENSTFCGNFSVWTAAILNNTLIDGRIVFNGSNYFGPVSLSSICAGIPSSPVGSLVADPSVVNNSAAIVFRYSSASTGYNVTIGQSDLFGLDNTSTKSIALNDNGTYPDAVANDAVYSGNYTVSALNNQSDGNKTIVAQVFDGLGNNWTVRTNVTLDKTPPYAAIVINSNSMNVTSADVTLNITFSDATLPVKDCRFANEGRVFGSYETCNTVKAWALSGGNGLKTVVIQVRDVAGNMNETNDTITLQSSATTIITPLSGEIIKGSKTVIVIAPDAAAWVTFNITNSTNSSYTWNLAGTANAITNDTNPQDGFTQTWTTTASAFASEWKFNLTVISFDSSGNQLSNDSETNIEVDNAGPAITFNVPASGATYNRTINLSVAVTSDTRKVTFEYSPNSGLSFFPIGTDEAGPDWNALFNTATVADGSAYVVRVNATDDAGNSANASSSSFTIDNTGPTLVITVPGNGSIVRNNVTMQWLGNESNTSFVSVDGGPFANATSGNTHSLNTTILADGAHTLQVRATDAAGNAGFSQLQVVQVDNTGPGVSIIYPLNSTNLTGTVFVVASASAEAKNVTFRASNDNFATFVDAGCTASQTTVDSSGEDGWSFLWATATCTEDNDWQIRVTAEDSANNRRNYTVGVLRVDNTVPTVNLLTPADSSVINGTITISATTGTDVIRVDFEYSTQSGVPRSLWYPIGSDFQSAGGWNISWNTRDLPDGSYGVRAKAVDGAGLTHFDESGANFDIDNTPPVVNITSPAAGAKVSGTVSIAFTLDGASKAGEIQFDGGNWIATSGSGTHSWNTASVNDSAHAVRVRGNDSIANVGYSDIRTLVVDNTNPIVTITNPQNNSLLTGTFRVVAVAPSDTRNVTFNLTGGCNTVYDDTASSDGWTWDMASASACGTGEYAVTIFAIAFDAVGNRQLYSASGITIDNDDPDVQMLSPNMTANVTHRGGIVVSANASSDVQKVFFEYSPNNGTYWLGLGTDFAGTDGWNLTFDTSAVADGTAYKIRANATDKAGLSKVSAMLANFTIDNTAPVLNITFPRPGSVVNGTFNVTFTGGERGPTISVDGRPPTPADNLANYTWNTSAETEGTHTLRVNDSDAAGNIGYSNTVVVKVDNTPGVVQVLTPRDGAVVSRNVTIIATAPDNARQVKFELFNGSDYNTTIKTDTNPADGWVAVLNTTVFPDGTAYRFRANASDELGLFIAADEVIGITFDNTAPTVAVDVPNANGLYKGTLEVNASSSADTSSVRFEYRRGTGDWTALGTATTSPFRVLWDTAGLPDAANYEVRANATDRAGLSATASNANVEIDNTPPVITINNPVGGSTVSGTVNITFTITGSIHSVQVQFDGGSWAAATASTSHTWDTTPLTDQAHILRVRANDSVNNTGYSDLRIVTVNNGGAPVAILSPGSGGYKSGTVTIEVSAPGNTYNVTFNISNSTAFYNTTGTQGNVSVDNVSSDGWTSVWDTARFAEDGSYNINVQAFTSNNTLLGSRSVTGIEVDNLIPSNVTNMTITPHPSANSGAITLNWTSSASNDVDVYRVHRSQTRNFSAVSGTLLKSVSANSTTDSVPSGTWYYKVIVADNVGRESNASNEVNVTVTLAGPTGSLDINSTYARSNDTVKLVYTGSATGLTAIVNASEMQNLDARVLHDFEKLWTSSNSTRLNLTLNTSHKKAGSNSVELTTNSTGALDHNVTVDLTAAGTVNLSSYNRLLVWVYSNITGNVLNFTFGTDNYTQAGNFTVNIGTANSWEQKVFDISGIPASGTRGNRSSIRYLMFNVTTATPLRLLLDDLEASSQISMLDTGVSGDDVAGDAKYSALYNVTFYSNVSDGTKTVKALVDDGAGNFLSPQDTVTVDNTIPFANITVNDGAATTTGTSVTLTLTFTDGTSGVKDCRYTNGATFGSEAYESCQGVKAWALSSGGGTKTVSYEARDNAGNTNSSSDNIVLDTTVPSLFITFPAPGARLNGTVNITFSGAETNAPQISIDGANYTATTLNNSHLWNTSNYSEGSHTLRVKDTDSAGNVGYTEPLVVEVDNIAGVVTILQPKDNEILVGSARVVALAPVNARNMTFWLRNITSGQLVLVYTDTLVEDGWNFTLDTTLREDGLWELSANATDDTGRYIDTATALNLRIDNVAPAATLQQPANGATLKGTVIINVTASSDARQVVFEYSNNSGTGWQPIGTDLSPSAGWTFAWDTRQVNDASTYRIRANVSDYAGLSAIAQNTADFTIDNTAPVMNITAPAPGSYVTGIVTIAFTGNQSANSELSIDGNVWTNITNATSFSWNTSAYNDGTHTLQVRNNDSISNIGYSPTISVVVDNTNPSIAIINPLARQNITKTVNVVAAGSSDISTVRFFINVTDGGTFSLKNTDTDSSNGWGFSWDTAVDCSGECAKSEMTAEATDRAGLKRNYTITGFEIDNSVPTTTLRAPADSVTVKGVVVMNATTASDAVRMFFEYSRDGNVWYPIGADLADTTGWTLDWDTKFVPDGTTYRTRATATDNVGLTHTATNGADITIDNTPPAVNITAPAAGAYVNGVVTVTYTSSETLRYPYLSIDGGEWINVSASGSYSWNTSAYNDGTHTLQARDNDTINNTGFSRAIALIVDNANPIVAITYPHSNTSIRGSVPVLAIAPPDTSRLDFYVNNNTGSGWVLRRTDTNKADGWDWLWDTTAECAAECTGVSLRVNSTDAGGLQGNFTVYNLEIDNSAPAVTLLAPANGATIRGAHVVSATSSSDTTQVVFEYSPDSGTTWYTIGTDPSSAGGWNITWQTTTVTDAATYRIRANATDNVGLNGIGQNTADFTIDNVEAATTIISPKGGSVVSGNFTVVAVAPDTAYYVLFKVFSNGTNYSMNNSLGFTNDSTPADGWTARWNTTAFNESSLYNLSAVAYDVNGNYISNATEIGIEVDNAAPSAPVVRPLPQFDSDGVVQLEWSNVTASVSDVVYYNVYRSTNISFELSAAARIKNVSRNFNATTDFPGVNAKYYYKVTAVDNALFESAGSNEENTTVSVTEAGALVGVLSANDSIVKDGDTVVFRYSSSVTDLNVTINSTELQRLDNSTRLDLRLMDSGASPDDVADDAVYTANFTLSALNNISDGIVRLRAIVNDSANNQFLPAINLTLDNTAPNASIIISNGDANTSSSSVTLRLGFNDTLGGVQSCRFADENRVFGEWEGCIGQRSWTLSSGSGLKTVVVQVKDNADNINETNDTITYQALAAVTILRPATDAAIAGNVLVEAVGPAITAKMEFRIYNGTSYWPVGGGSAGSTNDSTPETGFSATWATPSFVDTIYNLTAIAYDANGNYIANDTNANLEVDNTAPAAPVLAALPQFDTDGVVALNWSNATASAADVVYYNIYRSTNVSFVLSSATRVKNVSRNFNATTDFPGVDGTYYYKVTAVDNVLLESAASNEVSTTITTAVGAVFGTLAANQTVVRNGSSVLFTFTGNKLGLNVSFNQSEMQRLDNTSGALLLNDSGVNGDYLADDAVYSGIYTLSMLNNLSDGLKQLAAEVNDSAGNLFRPKVNITLDNTKPNVTVIINGNLSLTTSRIVSLAVTANDSVGIGGCRFANEDRVFGDWESCTATKAWQLSALTGSKAVVAQARDKAGNVQEANDSIEYRAPVAGELAASPAVVRNSVNITFTYTGSNVGFNATINTTELQRLDNTSTKDVALPDDGIGPDAVANDGIYTGNYSISSLNNASDGIKRITATVNDTEGNVLRPAVNITLDNTRPNATITIFGLSPAGFTNISTEYTFSRAVTLLLGFNDTLGGTATTQSGGVRDCRFANENQQFTDWEACQTAKSWLLSDGNGNKTVILEARDVAGNVNRTNDTIYLNTTAVGLDQTLPATPTVVDDGLYTNANVALHAKWNATDYENDLLHVPLEWEYRIAFDNFTRRINDTWQYAGIAAETTVYGLNLSDGANYTFEVRAINTAGLRSANGTSDGIIVDTTSPGSPLVNSTASQTSWTSGNVVTFNFTAADNVSGVASFSYVLDANATTIPDNVPESMSQHAQLSGSYNDGKSTLLKFNNTGNASAVFIEVKSNASANDVLRVTLQLAESSVESPDAMGYVVYAIASPPTGFDMTGSNISRIVNTSQDIAFVSSVLDATTYAVDVPMGTAVAGSRFFVAVAGDMNDDNNRLNLLLAASNTSIDSSTQSYQCREGVSGCSNTTATADYGIKVELRDLKQDNIWHRTYTVGDGRLYFHVKAKDLAGNVGGTSNYTILVDTSAPSTPQMNQSAAYTNTTSVTFNWTQSLDADSGVGNYSLQVDNNSDFSSPEFYSWVGNVTNRTVTGLTADATYYARVHSSNLAGVNSSWSSSVSTIIDTTAPSITFSKPSSTGVVASQDVTLATQTNEKAMCTYSGSGGADPYQNFTYTNSTYHETKVSAATGANTYSVQCKDTVLNTGTATVSFTVSTSSTASSIALHMPASQVFTGDVVRANATVTTSAGQPLGEIGSAAFAVSLNGNAVALSVFDNGAGNYTLVFDAPSANGTYAMKVDVGSATASSTLNVQALLFTVQYVQSGVAANTGDRLIYFVAGNFSLGLATDSKNVIRSSTSSALNLTSNARDGTAYIFVTRTGGNVERVESLLKEQKFLDTINPSFGYAISLDTFVVYTDLEYDSIALSGNRTLTTGRYNLIIENKGFDTLVNKTKLEVRVQ